MGVTRSQSRELELILRSGEQVAIKGQFCVVAPDVRLGRNVTIHSFVNLYGCAIGDDPRLGTFVEVQKGASIGKRCKISSHTFICGIGSNATILGGVVIGARAIVGAGSVVTRSVQDGAVVAGNPARELASKATA